MTTWNLDGTVHHVLICNGGTCMRMGAEAVTEAIREQIAGRHADDRIHTTRTRCTGRCADRCVVIVYPEGVWYRGVTPEDAPRIVRDHLLGGKPLEDLCTYTYAGALTASGAAPAGVRKPG